MVTKAVRIMYLLSKQSNSEGIIEAMAGEVGAMVVFIFLELEELGCRALCSVVDRRHF